MFGRYLLLLLYAFPYSRVILQEFLICRECFLQNLVVVSFAIGLWLLVGLSTSALLRSCSPIWGGFSRSKFIFKEISIFQFYHCCMLISLQMLQIEAHSLELCEQFNCFWCLMLVVEYHATCEEHDSVCLAYLCSLFDNNLGPVNVYNSRSVDCGSLDNIVVNSLWFFPMFASDYLVNRQTTFSTE